mgnify:CR=1 FL=1
MTARNVAKLQDVIDACAWHAAILGEDLEEHGDHRYDRQSVDHLDRGTLRLLDQMAYRFTKLQDTIGQQALPGILELAEEPLPPETPFAQKLQQLERLDVIPSAEAWRELRETRNAIAHEYPDQPEIRAAVRNRFVQDVGKLLTFWSQIERSYRSLAS